MAQFGTKLWVLQQLFHPRARQRPFSQLNLEITKKQSEVIKMAHTAIEGVSGDQNGLLIWKNQTSYPTAYIENNGSGDTLHVIQKGNGEIAQFRGTGNSDGVSITEVAGDNVALAIFKNKTSKSALWVKQEGTGNAAQFEGGSGVNITGISGKHNALHVYDNQTEYPTVLLKNNGSGDTLLVKQEGSGDLANFYSPGKAKVFVGGSEADLCLEVVPGEEAKDNQPKLTLRQKGSKVDGKHNYAVSGELGYFDSTDDLTLINRKGDAFLKLNSNGNIEIGNSDSTIVLIETIKALQTQIEQLQQEVKSLKGQGKSSSNKEAPDPKYVPDF